MKRLVLLTITVFVSLTLFLVINSNAAVMEDYCQVPPYVIQNVAPNVMIMLDNSGSMFRFSYYDGFTTPTNSGDDNDCADVGSPCTGFTEPGTYPGYKYYGYFNSDYWYTYSSNRFVPSAPQIGSGLSGARAKLSTEWDGNFLNWLTMRRVDIIRKVMTGGANTSGEGSGYDRLRGEIADCDDRGKYKRINNAQNYTPYSGNRKFYVFSANAGCGGGGSGTSSFGVRNASDGSDGTGNEATFNVAVRVPIPVQGVLQDVVGARARIGLSFYRTDQGGYVQVYVSGGSLSSTVNQINLTRPTTNTPLAETLWTMVGYFAQQASISSMGSPGPRYASGDYQINNNVDPLNYGTGGQPAYRSCAKSFILLITDGEPCSDGNLPANLSNYAGTNPHNSLFNCSGSSCPARVGTPPETYNFPASSFTYCSAGGYVAGIEDVALYMHTTDLRNKGGTPDIGVNNISGTQNLTLYAVFAFGQGSTLLRYAAINGGFEDLNGDGLPDSQAEWDNNNDGEPDTFYEAVEGNELERKIKEAFLSILKRAASGTAASVLASGEGQGANLVQAVFYPRRQLGNDVISWTGLVQNLWYHVDPYFANSSIREDTFVDSPDPILNLIDDYIVQLYFDATPTVQMTKARRFQDSDGDGDADTEILPPIRFEDLSNLWEAGKLLWSRDLSSNPRNLYTSCISGGTCIGTTNIMDFSTSNDAILAPYFQLTGDLTRTRDIIRYLHGYDLTLDGQNFTTVDRNADTQPDYRYRTVTFGDDTHIWKLGDILNSTPRIASWVQLNNYDSKYNDTTYKSFIDSSGYKNRGMVFSGGNDGMLHAFKLGILELTWSGQTKPPQMAKLTNPAGFLGGSSIPIGHEMWAFIPKNALPYLKYFADPDYCHVYTVDLAPYIFDASIGAPGSGDISNNLKTVNDWRTILIGAMRTGGACRGTSTACADVSGDGNKDCVNTPVDVGGSSVGYSTYFALDVTDQNNPTLLWEFSNPQLGFATTGPAAVRIGADKTKNGKWFVVLGSGPTGPISTADWQFLARSDQNLRFFVLDLKTGSFLRTIDTGIQYAFAGSMLNSTNDSDLDYQDDAIYIGYTKRTSSTPYTWTNGGVGRLVTKENLDAGQWAWSTVIDNIGPVTSSIVRLQKNRGCSTTTGIGKVEGCLWLYFGTGRYYFAQETGVDDQNGQRAIYGVKEPCVQSSSYTMEIDSACTSSVSGLTNSTDIASVPSENTANAESFKGWYINLDASSTGLGAERVITDPLTTSTGLVFFTSSKPYTDVCAIGGKSFIWVTRYNTGGAPSSLKGVALLQVSTAAIEQINLATAFTEKGGRRSSALEGLPPTQQGLSILSTPPPVKRTIHIRER